ncbi:hypothetical protein KKI95_14360 [Xenorhabdus bovienii]|uniref:defense against restriction DarA-related protein n=1 Tax=Xenorhabdus bovienii TaxID=40576 RepID=UPI00237CE5D0|nr:hypothetical protein [Xenorhabdus bovienii]MDE1486461.1 hypothetical protein [Xenorhabdus bovienii]MDE1497219.1 hypothetical protein [Xenorhabdus bovienii]MDE9437078.1 hypothetical protein [Xenorhabdus bovienii]MDE9477223.1 hypothetical protein [Xenorhabdus bovienii]MDE9494570.1 hypothetical protein [Xenorhabdus bovienii]
MSLNLMSQNGKKYTVLNYDQLNEKGLKKLTTVLANIDCKIVKLVAADTARKKDGIPTKTFSLHTEDGQEMAIQVNDTGDISAVKLNGKIIPFTSPSSIPDLARQIAAAFKAAAPAFASSLAKKLANVTRDEAKKSKLPSVKSNAQRLQEAKEKASSVETDIAQLNSTLSQRQDILSKVQSELESTRTALNSEQATTRQLKEEIAYLEEAL